jgi:hypothetical protein
MAAVPPMEKDTDAILAAIWGVYNKIAIEDAADENGKLRASSLGGPCERALWYSFRWADLPEPFEPRITRLFDTGKREEIRVLQDLRVAGIKVHDSTVDEDGGRVQFSIEFGNGHGKGSVDGVLENLPRGPDPVSGEPRFYKAPHLLEIKTHSLKSFEELHKKGMRLSKPQHYAQMQLYMRGLHLDRGLYWATCKDTDHIYLERVRLDVEEVTALDARAQRIVFDTGIPNRIFDDIDNKVAWVCRQCSHRGLCHYKEHPVRRNCRTCISSTPQIGGGWHCARWGTDIDEERQRAGCPSHLYLPWLIPGEQLDAGVDGEGNLIWTSYIVEGETLVDSIDRDSPSIGLEPAVPV